MPKIKYFQLALKNGECKKLISPNKKQLDTLIADGWTLHGFDNEADIPANPILDNSEVREMTADEITDAENIKEVIRQAAKPDNLKQAENDFFALIAMLDETENLGITHTDNPKVIETKGAALTIDKKGYYGTLLQNAIHEIEINGGSWSDLPNQAHNLEE